MKPAACARSHFGCSICRLRKLKCDEARPVCGQCMKGSRDCRFVENSIFRSFEGPSLVGRNSDKTGGSPARETAIFDESNVWLEVPMELTFVHIDNPYELDATDASAHPLETHPQPIHDEPVALDEPPMLFPDVMPLPASPPRDDRTATPPQNSEPQLDPNMIGLYLSRHFKEGPGQWMDAFDTTAFFSCKVPVMATTRPLLKHAVYALAAKHLHCIHSAPNTTTRSVSSSDRLIYMYQPGIHVDWQHEAAEYYHRALINLKSAINTHALDADPADHTSQSSVAFAAIAILRMYELMDAPSMGWKPHMSALPLFSHASNPMAISCSPVTFPQSIVKGPIFWSLARLDFLSASISETQTRLNLDDIPLWQNAGLAADENGVLLPFSPSGSGDIRASTDIQEDIRSNELIWLLGNIVNYLTSGDAINPEEFALPPGERFPLGVPQEQLLERWTILDTELQKWHDSLPTTFQASVRTRRRDAAPPNADLNGFEQIWYELPICAATMQSYHMACILWLVNKPQESTAIRTTLSARFRYYRQVQHQVLWHAREICGISLASPPDPVRVHSVLPLYVAGQIFHEPHEQRAVLGLLTAIEMELGWATSYHVKKLTDEWQEEQHPLRSRISVT